MEKAITTKVFNFRPMAFCALSLIFGILLGQIFVVENLIGIIILLVLIFAIAIYLKFSNLAVFIGKHFVAICFAILFFIYGFGVVSIKTTAFKPYSKNTTEITASGTIIKNGNRIMVSYLKASYYNSNLNKIMHDESLSGEYYLFFTDDLTDSKNFNIGDNVVFKGNVKFYDATENKGVNTSVFASGIYGYICLNYSDIVKTGTKTKAETFDFVKNGVGDFLNKNLSAETSGVAYSMLFGEKDAITSLYEDFKLSGMAHLLAVSGLHIGFFVALLSVICKLLKLKPKTKFFVIIGVLFIYAWICGFTVSVSRAFIMTTVSMLSLLLAKQYDSLSSLSLAAIIILIFRPFDLFSLGFQLSFSAVLGIILLAKPLSRLFSKFLGQYVGGAVAVTTSATIGTLPIIITIYSRVSSLSLLANLIAVPIASVGYMTLIVFSVISLIFPFMRFLMVIPDLCLRAIIYIAKLTANFDRAFIEFIPDKLLILAVFLLAFFASDYVFLNKKLKRTFGIMLALVLAFSAGIYAF